MKKVFKIRSGKTLTLTAIMASGVLYGASDLVFSLTCPGETPGSCLATFTGGLLTSPLLMPISANPTDASALRPGVLDKDRAALDDGFHVYEGAIEGGDTGTHDDVSASLPADSVVGALTYDMPSGGRPSPLYGARAFTQKMILFEEFGPEALTASSGQPSLPLPAVTADTTDPELSSSVLTSAPEPTALEGFLGQAGLHPYPTRLSNTNLKNPWWLPICRYLGRASCVDQGPIEGRPPGEGWSHQRWDEFQPQRAFKTAQAPSRMNRGFRDARQSHGYARGEFAPGGLYHNTTGLPGFDGTTAGLKIRFHPSMPVQKAESVWTFDGTLPPKLLMVRYGEPLLMRHYNALPIDVSANRGFGLHTISTHEHNGHNPAESDGFAGAFFFPGQFFDYRWPVALAGHDTINRDATEPRASLPCKAGESVRVMRLSGMQTVACDVSRDPARASGIIPIRGDYRETMSTHWFHDHMVDFTSQNVYKGNVAMMNYYSAIDRGNESLKDGINLGLPSGSSNSWGNRDYDVNLAVGDKGTDQTGQLWMNPFNTNGFLGDMMTVNFLYKPELDVRARRYRFRILNGAVARYMKIALVKEISGRSGQYPGPSGSGKSFQPIPLHMIANDGNIMEQAVAMDGTLGTQKGVLPMQSIAERYDVIIDFAKNGVVAGDKLLFVNLAEHKNGKLPNGVIPLADVLSGAYKAVNDEGQRWIDGDPAVGAFLRFNVLSCRDASGAARACVDPSLDPSRYVQNNKNGAGGTALKMLPQPTFTAAELAGARHRTFEFGRSGGTDLSPWTIKVDGGAAHTADTRRISAAPNLGNLTPAGLGGVEIWHILGGGGWSHPVHIHFEEGKILSRDGLPPPIWEKWGRKDMFRIGPDENSSREVTIAYRFREFSGSYVEHCHNTTHEDLAMLLRWDIEKPGQTMLLPAPIPTWDGVHYIDSVGEETARTGQTP